MILSHKVFVFVLYLFACGFMQAQEPTVVLYANDTEEDFKVIPEELFTKTLLNHKGADTLLIINQGQEDINWYSQQAYSWLYPSQTKGTIQAGSSFKLPIEILMESLPLAIYNDTLLFKDSKTNRTLAVVPIEVMIEAKPKITIPISHFSTTLFANGHKQLLFTVKNEGNTDLDYSIYTDVSVAWLQAILPTQGILAPGESQEHALMLNGEGIENGTFHGTAWISSNDPNQARAFLEIDMTMSTEQAALLCELNKAGLCRDETFEIPYQFKGLTLGKGNKIIAELSDPEGTFNKPRVIGEKRSMDTTGIIDVHIPKDIAIGNSYKIRLRGTDPKISSIDAGVFFSIGPPTNLQFDNIVSVCDTEDDFLLTHASPKGGSYSGAGVFEGNFSPRSAGAGNHLISYQFVTEQGCSELITGDILVRKSPKISHLPVAQICTSSQPFTLDGGRPRGGHYEGNGVEASGLLVPKELRPGTQKLTYIVEQTACKSEVEVPLVIKSSPKKPQFTQEGELLLAEEGHFHYSWLNNGKIISSKSQRILKPQAYGEYVLSVKNEAGCETLSTPLIFEAPDISQEIWNSLEIGPNPAHNHIYIQGEIKGSSHPSRINMVFLDSEGRSMIEASYGNIQGKFTRRVNWTGLKPGVYKLSLEWEGKNFQQKVIITE